MTHTFRGLVTGGGGFVGSHLSAALVAAGHEVVATLRPGGSRWRLPALGGATVREVDLMDPAAVRSLVGETRPDVVFHTAFPSAYAGLSLRDQVAGGPLVLATLLDALADRQIDRFVHLGSFLEYGPSESPHREDDAPRPASVRGSVKAAETQLVLGRTRDGVLPGVVLRVFSVYGPWEHPHRLVPTAFRAALEGLPLPLTSPGIGRDFVYAGDVADACLRAAASDAAVGEVFNVGGGRHVTNEEMVAEIEGVTGRRIQTISGAYRRHVADGQVSRAENRKTARILGWKPRTLDEGLRRTLAWMRATGAGDKTTDESAA